MICALVWIPAAQAQDLRQQAERAWIEAREADAVFRSLPPGSRTRNEHLRIIRLYQQVYLTTPHSGYSDDALINIATLYEDTEAFSDAVRTLRFLVSDYPGSKHVPDARDRIARLTGEETAGAQPGRVVETVIETVIEPLPAPPAPPAPALPAELVSVDGIRYWEEGNSLRVVVDLEGQPVFTRGDVPDPPRVYLDIRPARLDPGLAGRELPVDSPMLRNIRVAQNDTDTVRVVLDLAELGRVETFTLNDPNRLVIDVLAQSRTVATADAAPQAERVSATGPIPVIAEAALAPPISSNAPAQPTENGDQTLIRSLGLKPRRVVIDPGHGGHDPGTIGPSGLSEAEVVLDLAKRLRARIQAEFPSAEVLLTRENDTFVPLEARPLAANEAEADLFISIHANSSRSESIRGFETYFLNLDNSKEALDIAARENAASDRPTSHMQDIVRQIMTQEWRDESREFAGHVQRALASRSDLGRDRGVKQAPLVVLVGANMPSILAEVSFISNPDDERLLRSEDRRQQIADALFEGVRSYFGTLGGFRTAEVRD